MTSDPDPAADVDRRVAAWTPDLRAAVRGLYGERASATEQRLVAEVRAGAAARSAALSARDSAREREPDWFQRPERVGYISYVDRLGGTLKGVSGRIEHLHELGVDVLHLMSVLRPRAGEDDGGYAVDDYRDVDPRLGTLDDLRDLIADLHGAGISLVLDLVINHTSDGHAWAQAARAGDPDARALYLTYPDRRLPDAYERTLPEVFPDIAPGSFSYDEPLDRWVWTTFNTFQWDLDWSNPQVLVEMASIALFLSGLGVDVLRLDAVAFTGKRMGTNCQNQPEAHLVAQALRAVLGMAAPATVLLAEAIVAPDDLVPYLGRHERERRECELAYHNQLMVLGYSMLAEGHCSLARLALQRMPAPPGSTSWLTYVHSHDDIGWAISDTDASAVGLSGFSHRRFLAEFYRGDHPASFAAGEAFGANETTGDERTSGGTAALCGISGARHGADPGPLDLGIRRLLLLHALAFGWGGIPMIYMGDEVALDDDESYRDDAERAHDSRWRHRPWLDDDALQRRQDPGSVESRVWDGLRRLVEARRAAHPLHAAGRTDVVAVGDDSVLCWLREHPRHGRLLGLANVTRRPQRVWTSEVPSLTTASAPQVIDLLAPDRPLGWDAGRVDLEPYQVRWLTADTFLSTSPSTRR